MSFNLDVWKLLTGPGIFLFGMLLIEESVRAMSGKAFRRMIRLYTHDQINNFDRALDNREPVHPENQNAGL